MTVPSRYGDGMAEAEPQPGADAVEPGIVLAAAALLLAALPVVAVGFGQRSGPYVVQTYLFWSDLPLLALGLLRLPDLARRLLRRRLDVVTTFSVLVAALTVAWAVHPSIRGALQVLRLLGVAAAVLSATRSGPTGRRLLVGALAALTVTEVVLAVAQRVGGGPLGLGALGEQPEPLLAIGGGLAPQGTLIHPYLLAGLAVVLTSVLAAVALRVPGRARLCAAGIAVAGVAVGLTYSRAAVLALAGVLVPVILAVRSPRARSAAVSVLAAASLGVGVTALVVSDGWVGRAQETSAGTNVTSGRGDLAGQAFSLIRRHPLLGVGTGRYNLAVEEDQGVASQSVRELQPVHAVPLLLVAEGGLLVAAALLLLAVALVRAALRAGLVGWALLLGYVPFLLLDHFPVTYPQGLVMTAAWLAALQVASEPDPGQGVPAEGLDAAPAGLQEAG